MSGDLGAKVAQGSKLCSGHTVAPADAQLYNANGMPTMMPCDQPLTALGLLAAQQGETMQQVPKLLQGRLPRA